jgi:hypothetical protein
VSRKAKTNSKPQHRKHREKSRGNEDDVAQASEPVWQLRFPQLAFSVEARKLIRFNKSENAKGMWKSIFASCHTGSSACGFSCSKCDLDATNPSTG